MIVYVLRPAFPGGKPWVYADGVREFLFAAWWEWFTYRRIITRESRISGVNTYHNGGDPFTRGPHAVAVAGRPWVCSSFARDLPGGDDFIRYTTPDMFAKSIRPAGGRS